MALDSLGQSTIWGQYSISRESEVGQLTLAPDSKYTFLRRGSCAMPPVFIDEGVYSVLMDTVVLHSKDSSNPAIKFLVQKIVFTDTNLHLPRMLVNLVEVGGFEARYFKTEFYSEEGFVVLRVNSFDKNRIHTSYYTDGRIKAVESYRKGKKSGNWFYYSADGLLLKTDEYRNNKLVRTETTAGKSR